MSLGTPQSLQVGSRVLRPQELQDPHVPQNPHVLGDSVQVPSKVFRAPKILVLRTPTSLFTPTIFRCLQDLQGSHIPQDPYGVVDPPKSPRPLESKSWGGGHPQVLRVPQKALPSQASPSPASCPAIPRGEPRRRPPRGAVIVQGGCCGGCDEEKERPESRRPPWPGGEDPHPLGSCASPSAVGCRTKPAPPPSPAGGCLPRR